MQYTSYFNLWLFNLSHDIFGKHINNYTGVNMIKVKLYMHDGYSIYQTQ